MVLRRSSFSYGQALKNLDKFVLLQNGSSNVDWIYKHFTSHGIQQNQSGYYTRIS